MVVLISILIFIEFFGLALLPAPANAAVPVTGGPVTTVVTADLPRDKAEVKQTVGAQLLGSALGALVHGFSYFMRKLAYDSAMYVANGGKGQGALAFKQGFGAYLETVALDSAADAIGELGKPFGLNLCKPPDLNFQVFLQIGLRGLYFGDAAGGPQPNCKWQDMKGAWENVDEQYFGENGQLTSEKMFSNALRFENTDFGVAVGAVERVDRIQSKQVAGASAQRAEGEGFKAATDLITGNVKTPAQIIKEETYSATNKHQSTLTASQVGGIYGSGALQVIPLAGSVFLNTLATEGIKNLQKYFLSLFDDSGGSDDASSAMSFESAGFQMNLKKAKEIFSSFLAVKIEQRENYDLLTEFTTCPDTAPTIPGLNNCVMDDGLREAVRRADTGEPMTIREALKEGLLKGDWILASPRRVADNTSYGCYKNAYCYSNIQKLRRSRILPLGFEIAALLADPDHPQEKWTLEYVVNHFDDCRDDNKDGAIEPDQTEYPYCHLIDPNWVIKSPDTRCNGMVYSSNLIDQTSGLRAQECVDAQTCIKEKADGSCDFFGYCAREKKVWRLPGEACESYYNTCTTYTSGDGAFVSYLAKTVDYGECNFDSVGCLSYSAEKDGDDWIASIDAKDIDYKKYGRNQALYFNERIKNYSCSASDNGCSGFYLGTLKSETTDEYINNYDKPTFIKKAPDYLGCYDINKNPDSPEINWPQTKPELGQVSQDKKCADFAQVCLPEEVGCDSYTPKKGSYSTPIPGIAGEENKCDASCVGYDTFKQSETEFAPAEFPLYFIPTDGDSCPAQFAGCDEFTNIDELAKGGEGLEYYTDIKYCELPTEKNQKVFYSWYGSMSEGYVLKLHKLRPITQKDNDYLTSLVLDLANESVDEFYQVGSPAYATDNPDELNELYAKCNATGYNKLINGWVSEIDGAASLDCRALYDKDGKVYYRILDSTITVSEECHPLRKTTAYFYDDAALKTQTTCEERSGYWNNSVCQRCTNGGIYKDGACVYWAIAKPGESNSCNGPSNNKDAYNGCREYIGNAGGDVEIVDPFPLSFEPINNDLNAAKAGWWSLTSELSVVSESIQVGLHSLQIKDNNKGNSASYLIASSTLEKDGWYELSFWSRGKVQQTGVYLAQLNGTNQAVVGSFTSADFKLSIGDDWKEYKLGPVQFTGDPLKDTYLVLASSASQPILYFIDNIELRAVVDTYAIIKDSWKKKFPYNGQSVSADVPLACDSNPTDPFPGDALGCRAYAEESTGSTVNVTGFEKLCRVEAVGCRAVFDSYNTKETDMTAFNVWCAGKIGDASCELTLGTNKSECKIEQGKDGCYIDKVSVPDSASLPDNAVTKSTIIIPADTSVDAPVYLTVRPEFSCLEKAKGCQEVGAEEQVLPDKDSPASYEHNATYLINDPAQYVGANRTLCRTDLVGCEDFKAGSDIFYFKNPIKTGNSFCEYKAKVENDGVEYKGWFLKDVGVCYNSAGEKTQNICGKDSDCGETETCQDKGNVPCYENYLQAGGFYDIWSNNTTQYKGNVGVCPSEKNGCRELIDPADTSDLNPDGQPYYAIFDNRVTGKAGECESKVSQVEGCVLFNKTDEPNLLYDSVKTYKNSEDKKFAPVSPVTDTNNKDSNLLLKVIRDRQCAEWLACQGSLPVPDTQSGTGERWSCYALQPCADGSGLECTAPSTLTNEGDSRLLYGEYVTRDVSWSGAREYSGYSLFEKSPPANLEFITVKKDVTGLEQDAIFVGYINKNAVSACSAGAGDNGKKCGGGSKGICYEKKCVVSPDDSYPAELFGVNAAAAAQKEFYKYLYKVECRGYPEQASPFKGKLDDVSQFTQSFLTNASFCAEGENCDCNYIKVEYGSNNSAEETKYYELGGVLHQDLQKGGICQDGPNDGKSCSSNKDCADKDDEVNSGACIRQIKRNTRIGWNGYCLERDLSRHINGRIDDAPDAFACLTWLPLDYVPGLFDIYYSDPSIGYVPPTGKGSPGRAYCTEMLGVGGLSPDLEFDCDLTKKWSSNDKLGYNLCDNGNFSGGGVYNLSPESFGFEKIQQSAWQMIGLLSGSLNGFTTDGFNSVGTYHYISRVDVAVTPAKDNGYGTIPDNSGWSYLPDSAENDWMWDRAGGKWDDNYGYEDNTLGQLLKKNSIYFATAMATGGYSPKEPEKTKPYAALFPDVEWPPGNNDYFTPSKAVVYQNNDGFKIETVAVEDHDSGILRHGPNKAETLLTKDMIYAVSFVPLWLSENGDDGVDDPVVPGMGMPLTIYLDKDYPNVLGESVNLDMKKSAAMGNCSFCKYWTMKTEHKTDKLNNNNPVEGYLLQWMAMDPLYGEDPTTGDSSAIEEYVNANTYLVDPLASKSGKSDVDCKTGKEDDNHFIAVEILFDKETGKFIGYRSRNCEELDADDGDEFGYAMAVIFTLKPMCVEAVKVVDLDGKNKAYTDNVWPYGKFAAKQKVNNVDYGADAAPFGSARFNNLDNCDADNPWCYLYPNPTNDILHAGTPWQCLQSFESTAKVKFNGWCTLSEDWLGKSSGYNRDEEVQDDWTEDNSPEIIEPKHDILNWLFATIYERAYRMLTSAKTYNPYGWGIAQEPFTKNAENQMLFGDYASVNGTPPKIYPAVDCVGQKCKLDSKEQGFSVNGIIKNKVDDKLFGIKTKMAQVQFFAWADHNQMPLRRIMVDWQEKGYGKPDNTISGISQGYYTNYKPYCGDNSGKAKECVNYYKDGTALEIYPGQTCNNENECPSSKINLDNFVEWYECEDVGPKFGNQPNKTCKDSPVIRIFNYTCDVDNGQAVAVKDFKTVTNNSINLAGISIDESLGKKWYNFLIDKGYENDDLVCVFQPRVQVLDNWGWCTGECDKTYKDLQLPSVSKKSTGCYNEYPWNTTDLSETNDQCALENKQVGIYQWVNFDNIIVVAPGD